MAELKEWNSIRDSLLYNNVVKRNKLVSLFSKEKFKDYIDNRALARSFSDPAHIRGEKIDKFLKNIIKIRQRVFKSEEFTVLEIGSFMGLSSKFFVSQLEDMKLKPKVHCVDLMRGYFEVLSKMNYSTQAFHLIYNTEQERLKNKIFLHAGKSTEILPILDLNADMVYIDGEHTSGGVYADLVLSLSKVADKGFILIDDVSWKANLDKKTVIYGIECFLKNYSKDIIQMYARGNTDGKWGFFEATADTIRYLNTKHLLLVVNRNEDVTLESIHEDVKRMGMYFSP